ncbi:TPA: hypothetical protein ACHVFG_001037, partial [Streptococcus suis]
CFWKSDVTVSQFNFMQKNEYKGVKMAYTVTVLFDHMLEDEMHYFENEADALKCKAGLEARYRGQRLYSVKMEEV